MEAISTHAKQAATDEQERRHSEEDLQAFVGVSLNEAYLVHDNDDGDYVMVVTGMSHHDPSVEVGDTGVYRRPNGVTKEDFRDGIVVHAEFYRIKKMRNGVYVTQDEPFQTPTIYRNGLRAFRRRPLETASRDHAFVLPR